MENEAPLASQGDLRGNFRSPLLVLKVRLEDGGKVFFGYGKNISRSGMFITTINPREPGARFEVEIPLPAPIRRTIQCNCEVVWKREFSKRSRYEPGMGMKFIDMPADAAAAIEQWVKSLQEDTAE